MPQGTWQQSKTTMRPSSKCMQCLYSEGSWGNDTQVLWNTTEGVFTRTHLLLLPKGCASHTTRGALCKHTDQTETANGQTAGLVFYRQQLICQSKNETTKRLQTGFFKYKKWFVYKSLAICQWQHSLCNTHLVPWTRSSLLEERREKLCLFFHF